jgi:hypothetical protein
LALLTQIAIFRVNIAGRTIDVSVQFVLAHSGWAFGHFAEPGSALEIDLIRQLLVWLKNYDIAYPSKRV